MNNVSIGTVLVLLGLLCWILVVLKVGADFDLWVLGWAFVVAGWLFGVKRPA